MTRRLFAPILALFGGTRLLAQVPNRTSVYYDQRRREDFIATADNQTFTTAAGVRSSYVEVFLNGLLQTEGSPGVGDYSKVAVGASQKITFNSNPTGPLPAVGHKVTLFYYPT